MDSPIIEQRRLMTRRHFFGRNATGIGIAALSSVLKDDLLAAPAEHGLPGLPHFAPKAKRVIYLFQSGGPSQMELFDYKPRLVDFGGKDLPDSVRMGQRLTGMSASQSSFPVVASKFSFGRCGDSGAWVSELLPYTAKIADRLTFVKSMHTEAINHDPAVTFFQTGAQIAGRPSIGSWLIYGLGSETKDLPAFVVMISPGSGTGGQPLYDRLWGSGLLPSRYQGVKFRSVGDPVLYLSNPNGFTRSDRRVFLDALGGLNQLKLQEFGDPEIATRIAQYEMAFRMQDVSAGADGPVQGAERMFSSCTERIRRNLERSHTIACWRGALQNAAFDSFNCSTAIGIITANSRRTFRSRCVETDQASAALVQDLKQRGMLDDTLVVWGGEFGRTVYCQGRLTDTEYGRDHHPRCFTIWMAGGGIKPGLTYGETDDYGYNITADPVHVHDLHATMLHCLGIDHTKLTFKFQGRHFRLTDVHGTLVKKLLA